MMESRAFCVYFLLASVVAIIAKDMNDNKPNMKMSFMNLKETVPPIYWINLDDDLVRRNAFTKEMERIGITNHQRISALKYIGGKDQYAVNVNDEFNKTFGWFDVIIPISIKEYTVTVTHLNAIKTAVENAEKYNNKYAMILEDDVTFPFDIDFNALIASAPSDFTILQLETCNEEVMKPLWMEFINSLENASDTTSAISMWKKHSTDLESILAWGLQGYIINTENVRKQKAFNDAVEVDDKLRRYNLNWKPYELESYCSGWSSDKTDRSYSRLRCDSINPEINIYQNMFPPTYLSKVPIVRHGSFISDLHSEQDGDKRAAAKLMWDLVFNPLQKGLFDNIMPRSLLQTRSLEYRKNLLNGNYFYRRFMVKKVVRRKTKAALS